MEEYCTDVIFVTVKDDESDSLNINAKFVLSDAENEEEKDIGFASLYIFNEYRVNSWDDLIDNADSISGDVLEVIETLSTANENDEIFGLIAVLDHIEINKEYRNKGYSTEFLDKIAEYLEYIGVTYVGLIPARVYEDKVIQNDEGAMKYYINYGFVPIAKRIGDCIIMGKSLL
ncbi:MAG: hypothetical protein F8N39_00350 [Clostridiaceae bacterium]|nr:hypothetical protein [Clostridiaceae bacterium]